MKMVDIPNARKIHAMPMPKSGGIAMALGALIPVVLWVPKDNLVRAVLIGSAIIIGFGIMDDIKNLSYKEKLLGQIMAALVVIFYGGVRITCIGDLLPNGFTMPDGVSIGLTVLVIVGVTNAINLSDGLDGLAGGISMLSFLIISFLASKSDYPAIAIISMAVVGGVLGFLRFNTHPANVFMGDSGSQLLGFLSITLAIVLSQANTPYSRVLPLVLIGFPILDTLTVMIERIAKGVSPFKADKNHFHHRLMRLGFSHSEAVIIIYLIQTGFISFGFIFRFYSDWVHLLFILIVSAIIIGCFGLASIKGWQVRRDELIGGYIRRQIRTVKEKKILIRMCFIVLKWGTPLLMFLLCFTPGYLPGFVPWEAFLLMAGIVISRFGLARYNELALMISLYVIVPQILYFAEIQPASWLTDGILRFENGLYMVIVLFVVLTMNLTRRCKGFKITPLDFLVLIVVLILPNLPSVHLQRGALWVTVAKALMLFFSYDVIIGEMRGDIVFIETATLLSLGIIIIRSFHL